MGYYQNGQSSVFSSKLLEAIIELRKEFEVIVKKYCDDRQYTLDMCCFICVHFVGPNFIKVRSGAPEWRKS